MNNINFIRIKDVAGGSTVVRQETTKTDLESFIKDILFSGAKTLESNEGTKSTWFKHSIIHIDTVYHKED